MRLTHPLSQIFVLAATTTANGAELPLHQVVQALFYAKPNMPLDFSGKDLSLLSAFVKADTLSS